MLPPALEAELLAGGPVVLQRVGPGVTAEALAADWSRRCGVSVSVATDPFSIPAAAVVDLRGSTSFSGWDARRWVIEARPANAPLLVLLDVQAATALLRDAPQTASWAGGVRLPMPPTVVAARSDGEVALGRSMLERELRSDPRWAEAHAGTAVGIELGSGRLFLREGDRLPLQRAQEALDHGIVYVGRVRVGRDPCEPRARSS